MPPALLYDALVAKCAKQDALIRQLQREVAALSASLDFITEESQRSWAWAAGPARKRRKRMSAQVP